MEYQKDKSGYQNVSVAHDEEELLSSTDVGDSVTDVDEEKQVQWRQPRTSAHASLGTRPSRTRTCISRFRRFRWLIDTALLLANISLSLLLMRDFRTENSSGGIQVGGDFGGGGPDFHTKIVKFAADARFVPTDTEEFFGDEVLRTWNTMMPVGAGWGEVTEDPFFTTSMTHQLHCVFMMARIYSVLATPNSTHSLPSDYHTHYLHCVDYLRQGIMCSADLAMEPHSQTDPDDNGPLDGSWSGYHVCKDYGHVIPYLEEQIVEGKRKVLPIDD